MDLEPKRRAAAGEGGGLPIDPIEPPRLDIFTALLDLARHKWLIIAATLVGGGLSAVLALRMPPVYTATAVVLPPAQQRPAIAAALGQLMPSTGALAGGDLMRSPAELYMALLGSRSVADGIIVALGLQQHYGVSTMTDARRALAGRTSFASGKDTLVRINVRDREPREAAAIANAYIDELYKLTSRFAVAESSQRRGFYEKQLAAERQALSTAESELRALQEKSGVLQINSQLDVTIRTVAQLRAEITSREVLLEGLLSGATEQNPEVVRLRAEIETVRTRLRQLEGTPGGAPGSELSVGKAPAAGLDALRALRQVRYHESLYEAFSRQYETARLDVDKQATVVQVVDTAVVPEYRSGPRRTLITLLGALSAALLSAAFVLARAHLRRSGGTARLAELGRALWSSR